MSGGVGQIRSAGKGGPEVVAPVGNRPERSEGIIRFRNFWFVKFRERAIRCIFDGLRPPWGANWTSGVFDRRRSGETCHKPGEGLFGFPCRGCPSGRGPAKWGGCDSGYRQTKPDASDPDDSRLGQSLGCNCVVGRIEFNA